MALETDIKNAILARFEAIPSNLRLSLGSYGILNKEELIHHVTCGDEIGRKIISIEMEFLRSLMANSPSANPE